MFKIHKSKSTKDNSTKAAALTNQGFLSPEGTPPDNTGLETTVENWANEPGIRQHTLWKNFYDYD